MNIIRRLKLSLRLVILIAIFSLGFLVFAASSFKTLNEFSVNGPIYQRITQGKDLIADVLPPPEYIIESYLITLQLAAATEKTKQDQLIQRLRNLKGEYDMRHEFWIKEQLDSAMEDTFLKQSYTPAVAFYSIAFKDLVPAVHNQDKDGTAAAVLRLNQAYETHRQAIDQVVQMATKRIETDEARAKDRIQMGIWFLLAILATSLGLVIVAGIFISRSITRPLDEAVKIAKVVASGDLTSQIDVQFKDEPGQLMQALRDMNNSLLHIVDQVRIGTDTIAAASDEIARGNLDLSSRTEQQATSLEETASSLEELTSTVRHSADNAREANQMAIAASNIATKGGAVVSEVVDTMASINESSKKIVAIIDVIDGIAFQTNILALNAAVEAARAQEQGRGFAVVAAEVRNLAQRSAGAAKEIKTLIGTSVEKVDAGTKLVEKAGATMNEVVESVKRVTNVMSAITSASQEQSLGIDQINQAVSQMDQFTQKNSALVEQAAAAAESLQEETSNLVRIVNVFRTDSAPARRNTGMEGIPSPGTSVAPIPQR